MIQHYPISKKHYKDFCVRYLIDHSINRLGLIDHSINRLGLMDHSINRLSVIDSL